ncbi:MobF family relaxase [Egicoccus sp. AB-alg6-2]|uniref:MobF family relaxase n=1 Tax=Egicoccus sp. AB-alg6-2 TaxID=3242692 RepID=UPI00359E5F93
MLSVKKILAGRGAVHYYLDQTRRGLADYYLPEPDGDGAVGERLAAPGSAWWGGGAQALELDGPVERAQFVPLYAKGVRPEGGYLGRKFRTQEDAAQTRADRLAATEQTPDPFERWQARQQLARSGPQASVAAWDATFSPVKSVSLLWAAGDRNIQQQTWAAHLAAVDAGLGYLQQHAAFVRAGRNGIRVLDTDGLVVARMNEWTSRDGDMQLHTHCLILNRARTTEDGRWRALDGRALLAAKVGAAAIYHRVLEAELSRRLDVAWRDRPDGLRELDGVSDELIEAFSTRRRAITTEVDRLATAYQDRYGTPPPAAVRHRMAQDATLATRRSKRDPTPDEALDAWEATARRHGTDLAALPHQVVGRSAPGAHHQSTRDELGLLLERLADTDRASFTRHDLLRVALDVVEVGTQPTAELREHADRLVNRLLASELVVAVHADDPLEVGDNFRRADGSSVFTRHARQRWALATTLDREAWLLKVAGEPCPLSVDEGTVTDAVRRHRLGGDQASAVRELLEAEQRIGLLVGPAGAGKTRTLRAVVDAWQASGGNVVGLSVSQAAAEVLATEAQVRAENTAKWLYETRRGHWQTPARPLLLIDEASMISTNDLVALVAQTRQAGGKVLLVGDPAQLSAIRIGGAFDLLAERHGAARLREIRRFTNAWEAEASLLLRNRDPQAIDAYAMRGRIHGGRLDEIETALFDAWKADALGTDEHGQRESVLMIVATNEQAAMLGERARRALIAAGHVADGPTVTLADNLASVGDHLVTRRNDRRLTSTDGGWVVNGQTWTITHIYAHGDADVIRHSDRARLRLPADYLAVHAHLAYATTAHRAQGMTVDRAHAAVDAETTHQQLYVAATRGRHSNELWVALDSDRDLVADDTHLPDPHQLLARMLARRDPDRLSAHQLADDSQREMHSLARLGAIFEDAARRMTGSWLAARLADRGLDRAVDEAEWGSLLDRVRHLALQGHDLDQLFDQAIAMRPLDQAHSVAGVLHWRLGQLAEQTPPTRRPGPLRSLPTVDPADEHAALARTAGELIRHRWQHIRAQLADTDQLPAFARTLGPRPADPAERRSWLNAATTIVAYRERYDLPGHVELLGQRPGALRPDAQAAYDHALHQLDLHLVRPYPRLDPTERDVLRQQLDSAIDNVPFNPQQLQDEHCAAADSRRAWTAASVPDRPQRRADYEQHLAAVDALEAAASAHQQARQQRADRDDQRRRFGIGIRRAQRS